MGVHRATDTKPRGIDAVVHPLRQAKLTLQQTRSTAGVHHPARRDRVLVTMVPAGDRVSIGLQRHASDLAVIPKRHPEVAHLLSEGVFKPPTIDLITGQWGALFTH